MHSQGQTFCELWAQQQPVPLDEPPFSPCPSSGKSSHSVLLHLGPQGTAKCSACLSASQEYLKLGDSSLLSSVENKALCLERRRPAGSQGQGSALLISVSEGPGLRDGVFCRKVRNSPRRGPKEDLLCLF
jgi:hypothetical protein